MSEQRQTQLVSCILIALTCSALFCFALAEEIGAIGYIGGAVSVVLYVILFIRFRRLLYQRGDQELTEEEKQRAYVTIG